MKKVWIARDKEGLHLFWGQPELTPSGWDLEYLFKNSKLNTWVELPIELFPEIECNTCAEFQLSAILSYGSFPFRKEVKS